MMVSRRNFLSITLMMLVLLIMFQSTQIYKEQGNFYSINDFVQETGLTGKDAWQAEPVDLVAVAEEARYVLLVGRQETAIGGVVTQWCNYTKRELATCASLSDFSAEVLPEFIMIQSEAFDVDKETEVLTQLAEEGVGIVFCDLPDSREIEGNTALKELLGIRKVGGSPIKTEGIRLFSGFLLGGEAIYQVDDEEEEYRQNLELEMPWYWLGGGTQTYMVGLLSESYMEHLEIEREDLPAVLWSHTDGDVRVFAVNGDYISGNTGIGILSAIVARLEPYSLYPIVDAQVLTMANYSGLAGENPDKMMEIFSGQMPQVSRDIVFPQMVAIAEQSGFSMSCMLAPQYDYTDDHEPTVTDYVYYLKTMKEVGAEVGLTMERQPGTSLKTKMEMDQAFWEKAENEYVFSALYAEEETLDDLLSSGLMPENATTIVSHQSEDRPIISYGNEDVTVQAVTSDATSYTFADDLRIKSVQTALGYSNVLLDMNVVFWPQEDDPSWEALTRTVASYLATYWKPFEAFEDTAATQCDGKIREFLALDYTCQREDDTISLCMNRAVKDAAFLLRTHGEKVVDVSNGTAIELERETYLIRVSGRTADIRLERSNLVSDN